MTRFIDRSNVNGVDNYTTAKVTHLYLKATEGTSFVDSTYKQRHAQGIIAGAAVGAYHFAGLGDPAAECHFFLDTIGTPKAGRLRPCVDVEQGQTAAWVETFVKTARERLGYWPTLYGSTSEIAPLRQASSTIRACPWWRAEYGPNDGNVHPLQGGDQGCAAHQYTSVATFPGISGHTDASIFIQPASALLVPEPPPPPIAHWEVSYQPKKGARRIVKTKTPVLWQIRHRRAKRRGAIVIRPVRKKA